MSLMLVEGIFNQSNFNVARWNTSTKFDIQIPKTVNNSELRTKTTEGTFTKNKICGIIQALPTLERKKIQLNHVAYSCWRNGWTGY
jgi:hypothetical protein